MTALGLDCGGSGSRWFALDSAGRQLGRGTGPRLLGHLFVPAEHDSAMAALHTLHDEIRATVGPVEAVVAGVSGLSSRANESMELAETLATLLEIPVDRITIRNDLWLAYHAAFRPGEGVLVYAGTGSSACHIDAEDQLFRAGGRGFVVDDAGSGFWIGQQAVRWMMRQADRTGEWPDGPLASALCDRVGGRDWDAVRAHVYAEPRSRVAALAIAVAEAARANDPVALSILEGAGAALADLALALIGRVGLMPVTLTGRAASLHPAIFQVFDRSLAVPETRLATLDPAETAARLALTKLGPSTR